MSSHDTAIDTGKFRESVTSQAGRPCDWCDKPIEEASTLEGLCLSCCDRTSPPERDEMVCDRCHVRHGVVWYTPDDEWNDVMRDGDRGNPDRFPFCCPSCFMQLADEALGVSIYEVRRVS